jgi:hypothetical protein
MRPPSPKCSHQWTDGDVWRELWKSWLRGGSQGLQGEGWCGALKALGPGTLARPAAARAGVPAPAGGRVVEDSGQPRSQAVCPARARPRGERVA